MQNRLKPYFWFITKPIFFYNIFFFLSIHFLRRKTRQLLPCSERGTNCLWFPLGIKYRLVLFSFMSCRSSTQFRSIWKEQKKVYGSLSECWAPCLPNKPCKNKNNQFCIMPQPLPCFCFVFASVHTVKPERNFFFLFSLINITWFMICFFLLLLYVILPIYYIWHYVEKNKGRRREIDPQRFLLVIQENRTVSAQHLQTEIKIMVAIWLAVSPIWWRTEFLISHHGGRPLGLPVITLIADSDVNRSWYYKMWVFFSSSVTHFYSVVCKKK